VSKLTAEEKYDLIDDLWRSLSPDEIALSPALRAELDRRLERLDRDGPAGVAWEDVYAEMTNGERGSASSSSTKPGKTSSRLFGGTRRSAAVLEGCSERR